MSTKVSLGGEIFDAGTLRTRGSAIRLIGYEISTSQSQQDSIQYQPKRIDLFGRCLFNLCFVFVLAYFRLFDCIFVVALSYGRDL